MDGFIDWLKVRLDNKLPGAKAHAKMVPPQSMHLRLIPMVNPRLSSVLLLLFKKHERWQMVFIQRSEYDGYHSGQISLPGGKQEPEDENLERTALREAKEEVGVRSEDVHVLGQLSNVAVPISGFWVSPYVGYLDYCPKFIPDPKEVQQILSVDISFLLDSSKQGVFEYSWKNKLFDVPYYKLYDQKLWGATAMMISEFEELLREYVTIRAVLEKK